MDDETQRAALRLQEQAEKAPVNTQGVESILTPHYRLSLADQKKQSSLSTPAKIGIFLAIVFDMIVPYGLARSWALTRTGQVIRIFQRVDPRGWAVLSWLSVTLLCACLGRAISAHRRAGWLWLAYFNFFVVQLLAGVGLLKWNFWYSTWVVYDQSSVFANAIDLGLMASLFGLVVFAVVFVLLLVMVKRDSPLNILLQGWMAFSLFLVVEIAMLMIMIFGSISIFANL